MSTLVIIRPREGRSRSRHRQHGLTAIDHRFYRTASRDYFGGILLSPRPQKQCEADPDFASEVDEKRRSANTLARNRKTKETGVLDALPTPWKGASRTLVDPTPSRIENLVHEIAMKRLLDGQFEESGLTLQEVHLIEESLVIIF